MSKIVYDGFVKVEQFDYKGKAYENVKLKDATACLVTHKARGFLLVCQYRPCIDAYTWEIPAGVLDKDLCSLYTIQEELDEECGIKVDLVDLRTFHKYKQSVGVSNSSMFIYQVDVTDNKTANFHSRDIEGDDVIKASWFETSSVLDMIDKGKIVDPKTIISIYKAIGGF